MIVDARGLGCPKPVIMAEEALAKIDEGIIDVLTDNEASVKNIARFAAKSGFYSESIQENGYWKVKIAKGYPCEVPAAGTGGAGASQAVQSAAQPAGYVEPEKDVLLIIGSDTMGKDEELGKILMKGFFETMRVTKEIPHTIFFLNAAVKLTTTNEDILPLLKEIEKMGVEIFTCGTCLKHYDLEKELKVGYRGTSNHIVEGIKDFKRTVWIG